MDKAIYIYIYILLGTKLSHAMRNDVGTHRNSARHSATGLKDGGEGRKINK